MPQSPVVWRALLALAAKLGFELWPANACAPARAITADIRASGDHPFLHAAANVNAIRLYEHLGFRLRRRTVFAAVRLNTTPIKE